MNELESIKSVLSKRDSILEPDVINNTKRLRQLSDEDPLVTIKRFSDNYQGYSSMTNILSEWLIMIKYLNNESSHSNNDVNTVYNDLHGQVEDIIVNELANSITQSFNRLKADEIILQVSDIPSWLVAMMKDKVLRKTLIHLYDNHSDSTLLGFTLRQISNMGYHREIASIIRESEYIDVFNNLLLDLVLRTIECSDEESYSIISTDLKKNCGSSEYTFYYSYEYLLNIENKLINRHIYNKIKRLRQDLEYVVLWSYTIDRSKEITSDLILPFKLVIKQSLGSNNSSNTYLYNNVLNDLIICLSKQSLTSDVISSICDLIEYESESSISEILQDNKLSIIISYLKHPIILQLLIDSLIHPIKCINDFNDQIAFLLAAITTTSVSDIDTDSDIADRIVILKNKLLLTQHLCQDIVTMTAGVINFDDPEKLLDLMSETIISIAVLRWIEISIQLDDQMINQSHFISLCPIFCQLIVKSISIHSLQQSKSFQLLQDMIDKRLVNRYDSNTFDHQNITNLSESLSLLIVYIYECIIYLLSCDYSINSIFNYIDRSIDTLDIDILRKFILKLLKSIESPYSEHFINRLLNILNNENIMKAIVTNSECMKMIKKLHSDILIQYDNNNDIKTLSNSTISKFNNIYRY